MGVYRSSNPLEWDDVDGVIIDESAPASSVQGVSANVAILVGQFQRGPTTLDEPGLIGTLLETFGKSDAKGNLALKNKKFGRLKIKRVVAAAAVKALLTVDNAGAADALTFKAKYFGVYGNSITVAIAVGSTSDVRTYTITDNNSGTVLPAEVYPDLKIAEMTSATFAASKLVDVTIVSTASEPAAIAATALATGADGTVADTDYETALEEIEMQEAGNVVFLDEYNATRNGYLKVHAAAVQDRQVVVAGAENDSLATSITAVASCRDSEGRIVYAYPWVETVIAGVKTFTSPGPWVASIISQTSPHIDPASVTTRDYMAGATGLKSYLSRSQFIQCKDAGIAAFEMSDGYIKIKSGITTQIADSSKVTILRRRMADFLTQSAGRFLQNYQNVPNKRSTRAEIAAGLLNFVTQQENNGILPPDSEVKGGLAKVIDAESLNTDSTIAAGFVKILWRQRIYSSMRFLVLQAEIGESVVVTEA